jgi:hypothetical protein
MRVCAIRGTTDCSFGFELLLLNVDTNFFCVFLTVEAEKKTSWTPKVLLIGFAKN